MKRTGKITGRAGRRDDNDEGARRPGKEWGQARQARISVSLRAPRFFGGRPECGRKLAVCKGPAKKKSSDNEKERAGGTR